ncbi:MAG: hypothetical protein J5742_03940 [Alphaproteobacteria bacterium]|nr:hypothetical protein [Alphaproteobacteria bacterium]
MKKIVLLSSLLAMVATAAQADWRTVHTGNCNPAAMHSLLEQEANTHRAVITEVICDETYVVPQPVMVYEPAPVYMPEPMEYIPIVDCVPGPTTCEYCAGRY